SGNSLMATVLLRLSRLDDDAEFERRALGVLGLTLEHARRAPQGFGHLLQAVGLWLAPRQEVAVVGAPGDPATGELRTAVLEGFRPTLAVAFGNGEEP